MFSTTLRENKDLPSWVKVKKIGKEVWFQRLGIVSVVSKVVNGGRIERN